jgi:hypothetical protein
MKTKIFWIVICASLLLTACGGAGTGTSSGPGKLTFKFKMMGNDVTKELTVKQGSVFVNDIIPKTGSSVRVMDYFINLANYDFDSKKPSEAYPKKDGDILIVIQVLGDKDATEKTPIKAGNYPASQVADGENVFGKAWHMQVRYFEEGRIKESYIDASYPKGPRKGSVKVNPISGDALSGEVDMSDDTGSLKGTFTGKLEPKQ